jgi:malonate transporter
MAAVALPLAAAVIGPQGAIAVAMGIAVGTVTISPLTLAVLEAASGGGSGLTPRTFGTALATSMRKPILWAPVLAFVLVLAGLRMPAQVESALAPLSAAAVGTSLFLTGLIVSADRASLDSEVALGTLVKNAVMPLMAWGLCALFSLSRLATAEVILLAAVPCGFFGLVFAAAHGKRPPVAGSTVIISTLASVGSLAVVVALLPSRF